MDWYSDRIVIGNGGNKGIYPAVVTVLTTVFDDTHPGFTGLYCRPEVHKGRWRHVRVAYNIMVFAYEFTSVIATNLEEVIIKIAKCAF